MSAYAARAEGKGFNVVGWSPEGKVYFSYAVTIAANSFSVGAQANIDGIAPNQIWGYIHGPNATASHGCPATGIWDAAAASASILDQVGPCNGTSGQSDF